MPLILKISAQERAKRLDAVHQALASVRLEGLESGHEAHSIYQRYVEGELTLEQMGAEIEARQGACQLCVDTLHPGE